MRKAQRIQPASPAWLLRLGSCSPSACEEELVRNFLIKPCFHRNTQIFSQWFSSINYFVYTGSEVDCFSVENQLEIAPNSLLKKELLWLPESKKCVM